MPIGKPISNSTVYVLDNTFELTPAGAPGELCTGGDGLPRGYLNDPDLTREKFIPNPYKKGELVYRTGDLVRMTPDGNIEFLGRLDTQVKIRGNRIELEEIETPLLKHEAVKEAVVVARDIRQAGYEIIAYIAGDEGLASDGLRDYLVTRIPVFMIPSYFVVMEKLPLTSSGKVDRRSLPEPEIGKQASGEDYPPPGTETEKRLASIWKETLGSKGIGASENFFDLGGHGLKVTRMLSMIQEAFSVELPFTTIFYASTIRDLAECIEDAEKMNRSVGFGIKSFDREMALLNEADGSKKIYAFPPGLGYFMVYKDIARLINDCTFYGFNYIKAQSRFDEYLDLIAGADLTARISFWAGRISPEANSSRTTDKETTRKCSPHPTRRKTRLSLKKSFEGCTEKQKEQVLFPIPAPFVFMESPPPPAGKIDLDAPPAPGESDGAPGIGAVAPGDLMETKMAGARAEALDAPDVGVHDDFFEPGGHSVPGSGLIAFAIYYLTH